MLHVCTPLHNTQHVLPSDKLLLKPTISNETRKTTLNFSRAVSTRLTRARPATRAQCEDLGLFMFVELDMCYAHVEENNIAREDFQE